MSKDPADYTNEPRIVKGEHPPAAVVFLVVLGVLAFGFALLLMSALLNGT